MSGIFQTQNKIKSMLKLTLLINSLMLLIISYTSAQTAAPKYKIANTFSIKGDGPWDYLVSDDVTSRLFVSHGGITQVVDSKTGELLGTIPNTKGVHGITIDQIDQKAFISCGRDTSVSIVDLSSFELLSKVKVTGVNPDAILYDKFSNKVFVFNGRSGNVTVIDVPTESVDSTTINLSGKPEFAVTDGKGKIYVNIEDKNLVAVIDAKALTVINEWSLAPGTGPSGLALDNVTHRLFSVCDNKMMVILNATNGNFIDTVAIGGSPDGCVFDPVSKRAFSSNGEGTVTVVQEDKGDKFRVLTTIDTHKNARTICIDAKTHHLFLPYAEYGETPAATKTTPNPKAALKPGTFTILDIAPI
ncbi:MAG: YncE family protein [Saprospiraceae bacterium]